MIVFTSDNKVIYQSENQNFSFLVNHLASTMFQKRQKYEINSKFYRQCQYLLDAIFTLDLVDYASNDDVHRLIDQIRNNFDHDFLKLIDEIRSFSQLAKQNLILNNQNSEVDFVQFLSELYQSDIYKHKNVSFHNQ